MALITEAQAKAAVDALFAGLEGKVSAVPFFGPYLVSQLQSLNSAVDSNFDAIYAHLVQGATLTVDTLFQAMEQALPSWAFFLEMLRKVVDDAITQQVTLAATS